MANAAAVTSLSFAAGFCLPFVALVLVDRI